VRRRRSPIVLVETASCGSVPGGAHTLPVSRWTPRARVPILATMWRERAFVTCLGALLLLCATVTGVRAQTGPRVFVTDVKGAIGVATIRQLSRAVEETKREGGVALIVRLDTPGGLVSATRDLIQEMVAAPVPIVVYVAPSGARAASAGTFIVYASHVAAMAPGTNLGAATPVSFGGIPGLPGQEPKDKEKDKQKDTTSASEQKAINDVVALLRSLAQLRGRDLDFAEKAVREAATLTAEEAVKRNVIDIVANDLGELIAALDGRKVKIGNAEQTIASKGGVTTVIQPDWRTRLLAVISDPNVAFILLIVGFYGLILEFWTPGTFVPGTIGGVSLILALIALSALPVHYGALALLLLGLALMIAEAFTPGSIILGAGGLVAFVVGSIFLFEGTGWDIEVAVSWPVIAGVALTTAGLLFGVIGAAMRAYRRPTIDMIGAEGEIIDWDGEQGHVRVFGEIWNARSDRALAPNHKVRITARKGLTLTVEPK
jgi:membrane-bound serine protease (ClpP class)